MGREDAVNGKDERLVEGEWRCEVGRDRIEGGGWVSRNEDGGGGIK